MANNYPSPCDSCSVSKENCVGIKCERWCIRYRYRQKQINAYAKRLVEGTAPKQKNVWTYPHPDEARRFLQTDPCQDCMCRSWCNGVYRVKKSWVEVKEGVRTHE